MSFEWFISRRYLRAKRKQRFISLITVISVLGVALGVLALIVVLSVYTGFTEGMRDQIIGINSHVIVQRYDGVMEEPESIREIVLTVPGVKAATPLIFGQALINSASGSSGIVLRGIDPRTAAGVMSITEKIISGSLDNLTPLPESGNLPGIIIGRAMAGQLRVSTGDKIRLLSPNGPLTPMGVIPKIRTCRIAGTFETGMYEYDSTLGFLDLDTARLLVGLDRGVHGLEIRVDDVEQADAIASVIGKKLGFEYSTKDWMAMNQNLFAALKLEKVGLFIALDLIILVAALNIISALIMVVMEKTRDIAILKSMGATTGSIMRIFFYQGMVIAFFGTSVGVSGGLGLCALLKKYKIIELPSNVYPMSTLPIKVVPMDIGIIAVSAIIITLAATLYPSWKASKIKPAEALTYE